MSETVIGVVFGSLCLLLVAAAVAIIVRSVKRSKQGDAAVQEKGWTRMPTGDHLVAGWQGWPFARAIKPGGSTEDVVWGQHQGITFFHLRWTQSEPDAESAGKGTGELERYNLVAIQVEHELPPLSVARGKHSMHRGVSERNADVDTGDRSFDRRFQVIGDPAFAAAVLTDEVRAIIEDIDDRGGWAFQPGWVTRAVPWTFWAGEDAMLEELERAAAPWRAVPAEVWQRHGGVPRFVSALGHRPPTAS